MFSLFLFKFSKIIYAWARQYLVNFMGLVDIVNATVYKTESILWHKYTVLLIDNERNEWFGLQATFNILHVNKFKLLTKIHITLH